MSDLVEYLFWIPTIVDLALLAFTYTACRRGGPRWYFDQIKTPEKDSKKNDRDSVQNSGAGSSSDYRVDQVWQLAMAAYSAYACLLPWAVYHCCVRPELRVSFCAAMTALMVLKLDNVSTMGPSALKDSKNLSLLLFNLPTYGGYVVAKTWLQK